MKGAAINDILISAAGPADYPQIWTIQLAAYATEALLYDYPIPPILQSQDEAIADCEQCRVFKACLDGRIIGSIRGRLQDGTCLVSKLMVLPEFRNQGIGTALLQKIESEFAAGRYELFTGTRSAGNIRLYQQNGYQIYRTDQERELVFLEKKITG